MVRLEDILKLGARRLITRHSPPLCQHCPPDFVSSSHPEREILVVLKGTSAYMLNGGVYQARPGDAFIVDHWLPHAYGYRAVDEDLIHAWFHASQGMLWADVINVAAGGKYQQLLHTFDLPQDCAALLNRRWDLLEQHAHATQEQTESYLKTPVNAIMDELALQMERQSNASTATLQKGIEAIKKYIRINKARDCTMVNLETIFGYNRFYLAHQFKKFTGRTVGDYSQQVRIQYVAAALDKGMKQKEIAFELGFSTPTNFWKWLQKHKRQVETARLQPE